jgi:hypothetical protein
MMANKVSLPLYGQESARACSKLCGRLDGLIHQFPCQDIRANKTTYVDENGNVKEARNQFLLQLTLSLRSDFENEISDMESLAQ